VWLLALLFRSLSSPRHTSAAVAAGELEFPTGLDCRLAELICLVTPCVITSFRAILGPVAHVDSVLGAPFVCGIGIGCEEP